MIDFSTLQGLTIPEGVVTQIADASGRVLWMVGGGKAVLQVEKITSNTYAGETSYASEQFILLDIYPKTNGTVKVTYGGLTKTITDTSGAAEPNAQKVFFGTFNGVSDSVTTPASGELTIEGKFAAFGCGSYVIGLKNGLENIGYCGCITAVSDCGDIVTLPNSAFYDCRKLTNIDIPSVVENIGSKAFYQCTGLTSIDIPSGVKIIGSNAFTSCTGLTSVVVPEGVISVGDSAFKYCDNVSVFTFPASLQEIGNAAAFKTVNHGNPYTVKMLATTPPICTKTDGFQLVQGSGNNNGTIIVPKGCGNAYKTAAGWSNQASLIVEVS